MDESEINKGLADYEASLNAAYYGYVTKHQTELSLWLIASLIAINGGSALAIKPDQIPYHDYQISIIIFVIGIICALLNGYFSKIGANKGIQKAAIRWGKAKHVSITGTKLSEDDCARETREKIENKEKILEYISEGIGVLSAVLWFVGILYAGFHMTSETAVKQPCVIVKLQK